MTGKRRPRVFVSFTKTGADNEFVLTRLWPCLDRQPVDVWKYEDAGGQIPGGELIARHLEERIDQSDVFLPVVSAETFQSRYTAIEVKYAQQRQAEGTPLLIVPLVCQRLQSDGPAEWPEPYARLKAIRYRVIDFDSPTSLEDTVVELCQKDVNIEYQLPPFTDPRLPYVDRFYGEVRKQCPRRDDREVGIYCRLLELLHRFSDAFQQEEFDKAKWAMQFFCMMAEYEFPRVQFYYPYVVRAVCEQLAGDPDAAEATFRGLLNNPSLDESTFSGLGQLCYLSKRYDEALEHYQQAQMCYPDDPAAAHGILLNSVMCGVPVDVDEAIRVIDQGQFQPEERATVQHVKAFALANAGRIDEAVQLFEDLIAGGHADASMIVHFARLLVQQEDFGGAIDLLNRYQGGLSDAILLHDLATYLVHEDRSSDAVGVYRRLVKRDPQNRRYRVELAQVLWWSGDTQGARLVVAPLLDPGQIPLAQTSEDFFLDGFANWICAQVQRADYDFQRSGFPADKHYRNLLPID